VVGVARERTALRRTTLSRPLARALEDGILAKGTSVFDYGCGRGGDVERLDKLGFDVAGYDPNFFPENKREPARVVNLGYVVNVIEDRSERAGVLRSAWELAGEVLVVSARLKGEERRIAASEGHGDGMLTGLMTFQKFFTQTELREWIVQTLKQSAVAAEPGIFYVFRQPGQAESYMLTRMRRSRARLRRSDVVFDNHSELLEDYMAWIEDRGRLPRAGEYDRQVELRDKVGTPRQAFQVIKVLTGEERWDRARVARYEDLLVYLALSRFHRRPRLADLPHELQYDIKDFFGSYKAAIEAADRALFAIGRQGLIAEAIRSAKVGKRMPSALYAHTSAISMLQPCLRVLEGCTRELLGTVADATIVKLDIERPRVTYLEYPTFDTDAHPALRGAYMAALDSLNTDFIDYSKRDNPPILHRKERFVAEDYEHRKKFERLTKKEERLGLFGSPERIGTAAGWAQVLRECGVEIRGHQLRRRNGR
jgi:DNA phosphorothioation-associated putative methyltransferase